MFPFDEVIMPWKVVIYFGAQSLHIAISDFSLNWNQIVIYKSPLISITASHWNKREATIQVKNIIECVWRFRVFSAFAMEVIVIDDLNYMYTMQVQTGKLCMIHNAFILLLMMRRLVENGTRAKFPM